MIQVLAFLMMSFVAAFAASCPSVPDISMHLEEMQSNLDDACNQVTDYYIAHVNQDLSEQAFNDEIRNQTAEEYLKSRTAFRKAFDIIVKASNLSSKDIYNAYNNGGFMTQPQNCFNKILMKLKVEDKRTKVEYESLIYRMNLLFGYYRDQKKRKVSRYSDGRSSNAAAIKSENVVEKTTKSSVTTTMKPNNEKLAEPTTKKPAAATPKPAVKTAARTTVSKPKTTRASKTTRKITTRKTSKASKPTSSPARPATSSVLMKGTNASTLKASPMSNSTKKCNKTIGSSAPLKSEKFEIDARSNFDTKSANSNSSLKCPNMPNILPYIATMQEKSSDLCEKTRFYYVDYINRSQDFVEFQAVLRKKTFYLIKAFNVSYNHTLEFVQKKTNVTLLEFTQAVKSNGFMNYPLSCYNKLITSMKIEYNKLFGRNKASMDQVHQLFQYYRM